ncbi:MAG TPA: D-alanyl-D-alanine carboxypeptidase/D-alanyl-D-alanine-endopeptidase [Pirellulaceae bacterium]|nr:D-alanyl-D-alanine carboxypeptidase/D-alanyl-D-alanine-endopeptidase [Pirellulaceae bacterium]
MICTMFRRLPHVLFAAIGAIAFVSYSASLPAQDKLHERVDALLAEPRFQHAHWGMLFVDLETGEVVLERNKDKLFAPASVTKLFSTATALDALGADHRFVTPVYRRGMLKDDGVLDGDLILVASGDLTLGGRTTEKGEIDFKDDDHIYANWSGNGELTPQDPLAGLKDLARQVAAAGIRKVNDVYIDDRLFDHTEGSGSGPGTITPIVVNDNVLDFTFEPGELDQPAKAEWRPQTALFAVDAQVQTVREDQPLEITIERESRKFVIRGKLPANKKNVVRIVEVPDARAFARALFVEALEASGVEVAAEAADPSRDGKLPVTEEYSKLTKVAEFTSPPFAEEARLILKVSHNLHASTLPLLVAVKNGKRSVADGLKLEGEFLARAGVDLDAVSFGGGAGGSRADYVTPASTVQLLRYMASRPDFAVYEKALPILGVDGTLAKSVGADSPAKGKVQAKTGTLVWDNLLVGRGLCTSKALGGYLTTASGKRLAFAAFVNGVPLKDGLTTRAIGTDLGRLCEIVHAER